MGQAKFLSDFIGKKLPDGDEWEVWEPLVYQHKIGDIITAPKGFKTDLASVPKIFQSIFANDGPYTAAAVIHDWLYNQRWIHGRSRAECDGILLEAMGCLRVPFYQRYPIYAGVRIGGWAYWDQK